MSKSLLSILIPITPDRYPCVIDLYLNIARQTRDWAWGSIKGQIGDDETILISRPDYAEKTGVEIIEYCDNKVLTIGEKRELLYRNATGKYVWQIDSDDTISENAIKLILEAIKQESDCITFREKCIINGQYFSSNHSLRYSQWMDNQDGFDYVRSPFYKDVIKTEIAQKVPFEHIRYNEDERFSYALLPHLHSEVHIDEELYIYQYTETNHEERYGLDRR